MVSDNRKQVAPLKAWDQHVAALPVLCLFSISSRKAGNSVVTFVFNLYLFA